MLKKINTITIESQDEFDKIAKYVEEEFLSNKFSLKKFNNKINKKLYYFIKSYRSNITEGNKITIGEFTLLVKEHIKGNEEYVIPERVYDDSYEIINLKKVYFKLDEYKNYSINTLQEIHRILGENIFKNNLIEQRGELKKNVNYILNDFNNEKYAVFFVEPKSVKYKLLKLFYFWNNYNDEGKEEKIFAKFIILQNALISIHPFVDGNGRTSRALSESYLEKNGYLPYTPYSEKEKRIYQKKMGDFTMDSQEDIVMAFVNFSKFILDNYENNTEEMLKSLEVLEIKIINT